MTTRVRDRRRSVRPLAYRNVNRGIAAYFFFVRVQRDVIAQVGSQGFRVDFGDKKHHMGKPRSFDAGIQIPLLGQHVGYRTGLRRGQLTFRDAVYYGFLYLSV